jgi:hypothetical protein
VRPEDIERRAVLAGNEARDVLGTEPGCARRSVQLLLAPHAQQVTSSCRNDRNIV